MKKSTNFLIKKSLIPLPVDLFLNKKSPKIFSINFMTSKIPKIPPEQNSVSLREF